MQDEILRGVWDFDVKERAYRNMSARKNSVFPALPFFMKNGTLVKEKVTRNSCREENSDYWATGDDIFC
ncbi:hypothetical protein SM247_21275 [Salmonella enterica]|nr:hypothetical protein [Salmonella enterica]